MDDPHGRPGIVPLKAYRNRDVGYSFIYPETWYRFDLKLADGQGVLFSPSLDDVSTCLSVEVRDLGTTVSAADLPSLRRGFLSGLRKVPGSKIESRKAYDVGFLIGLEAQQTFPEAGVRRKRWIRLLYQGTRQVRLIAQGSTTDLFDYWRPVFDPAMTTFMFGDVWPEPPPIDGVGEPPRDWLESMVEPDAAANGPNAS